MNSTIIESEKMLLDKLKKIQQRYAREGQSVDCHLERLLYENNLDYDNYLYLDTLLTLQKPKTHFADEFIFIAYHQIVELYFQLMLWELKQMTNPDAILPIAEFTDKVKRLSRYLNIINSSFIVMSDGMDKEAFLRFRYALFPASGFQSLQFRMIETYATDAINLVSLKWRSKLSEENNLSELYEKAYWKRGAIDVSTNTKSVTLTDFEKKHNEELLQNLRLQRKNNLNQMYLRHYQYEEDRAPLVLALRELDQLANIHWPNTHLKAVMKFLGHNGHAKKSTGGTNWRKYLTPRFQRIFYFPQLWSEQELEDWGKKSD